MNLNVLDKLKVYALENINTLSVRLSQSYELMHGQRPYYWEASRRGVEGKQEVETKSPKTMPYYKTTYYRRSSYFQDTLFSLIS